MIFAVDQQRQRLKWAFESCKNGTWGNEPDGEDDVVCVRAADFDGQSGKLNDGERTVRSVDPATFNKVALRPGDLVMEKSGGGEKQLVGRTVVFNDERPSVCSNFLARCRPADDIDPAYLNYLMLAIYAGRGTYPHIKQSTGIQNLDLGSYLDTRISIPELPVQQRIARFLDEKTTRIDALIAKKQVLLQRLVEKRQALITRAVTKGLNPEVSMKPSGVDWLGEIPDHWDIVPLRRMVNLVRGHDLPQQDRTDGDVVLISSGGESGTHDTAASQGPGIVTGRYGTIGRFYYVKGPYWPLNTTLYSKGFGCQPKYGLRMLEVMAHLFILNAMKSAVPGVDRNDLASESTPRPPRDEQQEISTYLEIELAKMSQLDMLIFSSVKSLNEHRSTLITSAVTGQLPELNG